MPQGATLRRRQWRRSNGGPGVAEVGFPEHDIGDPNEIEVLDELIDRGFIGKRANHNAELIREICKPGPSRVSGMDGLNELLGDR